MDYEFNNTNYRLNPTRGNELRIITSVGTKKIKKNGQVAALKDPGNPGFDFGSLYDTVKLKPTSSVFVHLRQNIFRLENRAGLLSKQL
ncbi:MAG: hypothetical protein WDN26_21470 [Chitinophagaceae bacterium]